MSDDDIDINSIELDLVIYPQDGYEVNVRTIALGMQPVLIVEPGTNVEEDAERGVLSIRVASHSFGETATEIADTLELVVDALRGTDHG